MDILNDMALFVEVVNAMSFRGAAKKTGLANSTLSRRISALEKTIGLRLLHRTTRKIELTEAGKLYYERCRRIVDDARLAHEQLSDMQTQPVGQLRISLPVDFAIGFLAPLLPDFNAQYPGIQLDLDLTPRRVDMISESFDLAIRLGPQADSNLIAQALASLVPRLYAAPEYLTQQAKIERPEDLSAQSVLTMHKQAQWTLKNERERVTVALEPRYGVNSIGMIKRMTLLGMGVALLPYELVTEELDAGTLVPVLPQWQGDRFPVYAITETRLLPAKTRAFIEFLKARLVDVVADSNAS